MIVAVTMMRNEADIAAAVVRHLLDEGVDVVIVADNLSTDATRMQLESVRGAVDIIDDIDPAHRQGEKMTALCYRAADYGADWVIPFDADEWWYTPLGPIGDVLPEVDADVVIAPGWDHIARGDETGSPFQTITRRRVRPQPYPKVALRPHPGMRLHEGNHGVDHPGRHVHGPLEYRHFQYRSLDQMMRKARQGAHALDLAEMDADTGTHWRHLAALDDLELAAEWARLCLEDGLIEDPAP